MATIAEMLRRITALRQTLPREVPMIIEKTAQEMVNLQEKQLFGGTDKFDMPIRPFYRKKTIEIKAAKGQPYDRVTLKDTGAFYEGIKVANVNTKTFRIYSRDRKDKKLEAKYGASIFGLDRANRAAYIQEAFFPELKAFVERTTKLKMK